ncbi:MAG: T9SS type A sorting domain-containing protein [Saprospiraceae bacterium]
MTFFFWILYYIIKLLPGEENKPNDWFYAQRAFPFDTIPESFYQQTMQSVAKQLRAVKRNNQQDWKFAGPTNIGGRITDIQSDATNSSIIYIASANGGVFKSIDEGANWTPIFDQNPIGSAGSLALQDGNPNILYVGTGEANGGGGSVAYDGNGMYKTNDGGNSWQHLGLELSGSISKILLHPTRPNVIYAACMGKLFGKNSQRGVYKSINGGISWEQIFFHSDSVGMIDMQMDPKHPDTLYVASWERSRKPAGIDYGGPGCNIYRTFDGGKAWIKLTNGLPVGSDKGRIGLALAPTDPKRIFAFYVDESGDFLGIYRTDDYGDTWTKMNGRVNTSSFGWWFGKTYVDPKNSNTVYCLGFSAAKSVDGGNQFFPISETVSEDVHVDQHALFINPSNTNSLLLGNDGGLYSSKNGGETWSKINNLPITQFYTCHLDYTLPHRLYGGTQDNSCMRTLTGMNDQWQIINGGDGFVCLVDPTDNKYVYSESQYGFFAKSIDGGASFNYALEGIEGADRNNWNTPVIFHPKIASTLFLGTDRLYKSTDRASNWKPISPTLAAPTGSTTFGTITTISVSPLDTNIIYCGTDLGKVWKTIDGGINWKSIDEGLPVRWITSIQASSIQKNKVYLTISGFRYSENLPHVYKSENAGNDWTEIAKGLPPVPVNKVVEDPSTAGHLIVATDAGVWRSFNDGLSWEALGNNIPLIVISDLYFHFPTRKLVAATYGRGLYTYNLDLPVANQEVTDNIYQLRVYPNPATDYVHLTFNPAPGINQATLIIQNIEGRTMFSKKISGLRSIKEPESIDIHYFPAGMYIISLQSASRSVSIKFIKH